MSLKLAWGITGSGDLLPETFSVMSTVKKSPDIRITAVLSKAAVKVVRWYKLWDELEHMADHVLKEEDANTPFVVGKLQTGGFDCLLVAPATANTVAKIVHGIADSIISNAGAQTNKVATPIYIMPVDQRGGTTITRLPGGEKLELKIRPVDIDNARKLASMDGIRVLAGPEEIEDALKECARRLSAE